MHGFPRFLSVIGPLALGATALVTMGTRHNSEGRRLTCVEALPETLDEFATCDLPDRKKAFAQLRIDVKRSLWREHLATFLVPQSPLTPAQRTRIQYVIAHLDEYIATDSMAREAAAKRDGISAKLLRVEFGDSLSRAIFAILGPDQRVDGHTVGEAPIAPGTTLPVSPTPYCNCRIQDDWCCHGTCGDPLSCVTVEDECGWFWMGDCNGICGAAQTSPAP